MHLSHWKFINKGLLIIIASFVVAAVVSILFLGQILLKLESLITESGEGVGTALALQNVYIHLDDAESAVRGYLLTGDESFVKDYQASVGKVPAELAQIKSSDGNGITKAQVAKLTDSATAKTTYLQQAVESYQSGAPLSLQRGTGSRLMDQIRSQVATITAENTAAIADRQRQSHDILRQALVVAVAVILFVVGICVSLVWYFRRTILRERALESTKNEFLSLASHQLRTPATNVKQYIGLILEGYLGDITKKQRDALQVAYKNNESEIRIMNDLLDVAKLDLKRIHLHKQSVNVVSIVRQVVKSFEKAADARGQTFSLKAPAALIAEVDRAYFRGVVEKLIDNALKYSRDNTHIVVKVRTTANKQMFEVIVRDRGVGIQKREVPKLFMKFSRLTNEFSANSEGSGMGLYWVKQIMDLHGGTVEVVSTEGKGSKFIARSPLR